MEDVLIHIMLVIIFVMMETTIKNVTMMVGTVVDLMSILITVQFVNASVMEDQVEEMEL